MTEQTPSDELDIKAINAGADAIRAAVRKDSPDLVRLLFNGDYEEWAAVAIKAAGEVFGADRKAFIDQQVAEAAIAGWDMSAEGMDLRVTMARESAAGLVMAAKTFLDANPGATNYVEQTVIDRETGDRYVIVFQKPGGKTPHELRQQAEAARDRLRAELDFERARVAEIQGAVHRTHARDDARGPDAHGLYGCSGCDDGETWPCPVVTAVSKASQMSVDRPSVNLADPLEALLDMPIRIQFWMCPIQEHGDRNDGNGRPVVTVEWRGDIAYCTAPGCDRNSQPTTPEEKP